MTTSTQKPTPDASMLEQAIDNQLDEIERQCVRTQWPDTPLVKALKRLWKAHKEALRKQGGEHG